MSLARTPYTHCINCLYGYVPASNSADTHVYGFSHPTDAQLNLPLLKVILISIPGPVLIPGQKHVNVWYEITHCVYLCACVCTRVYSMLCVRARKQSCQDKKTKGLARWTVFAAELSTLGLY